MVLNRIKYLQITSSRTHKNFGHKRQPVPMFTFLWHGFLTFTFIGLGIEWKRVASLFGADHDENEVPLQQAFDKQPVQEQENS